MADDIRVEVQRTGAQPGKRFAAFISYSHRDEEIGDWLHRRLEAYAVPSQLVGRTSSVGPIGKRLGKVFRDRADLSAAHDLGREIREGLEQSDALIVLCSPRSSGSKYVQEEICTFKKLGKGHRIFAAIIDGEPHAAGRPGYTAADECFPPALIYALGEDGALSSRLEPTEPIAADFREGKDGRENGALKIIAGLLDVGLDELVQRERQAERARRQRANLIAAAMAALALAAFGTGVFAWLKQNEAITNFQLAQDRAVAEAAARAQAEQNAREREEQRQNANIQRLAAIANAEEASAERDNARRTLHRIFVARAWEKFDASDYVGAAQYSLAGWRLSRDNNDASIDLTYRLVLGASMFRMGESYPPLAGPGQTWGGVQFSADGERIAFVTGDEARLWSREGALISVLAPNEVAVQARARGIPGRVSFSPTGAHVVSGHGVTASSWLRIWDGRSGAFVSEIQDPGREFEAFAFSPDEKEILTCGREPAAGAGAPRGFGVLAAWAVSTGQLLRRYPATDAQAVLCQGERLSWSRDGASAVSIDDNEARIANLTTRESPLLLTGVVNVSADGSRLLSVNEDEDAFAVIDAVSGARLREWNMRAAGVPMAVSANGQVVATLARNGGWRLLSVHTGQEIATGYLTSVSRGPSLPDQELEAVRELNASTPSSISARFIDHDRQLLLSDSEAWWTIDVASGEEVDRQIYARSVGRGDAGVSAADTGDAFMVHLENSGTGVRMRRSQYGLVNLGEQARGTVTPDGRALYHDTGWMVRLMPFRGRAREIAQNFPAFASDHQAYPVRGGAALLIGEYGNLYVVDAAATRASAVLPGHEGQSIGAAFSGDGALVLSADENQVRLWRRDGREVWARAHPSRTGDTTAANWRSPSFSPDGERVLAASEGTVFVWTLSGALVRSFDNLGDILAVRFSPNGARILVVQTTKAAVLDARTGARIAEVGNDEVELRHFALSYQAGLLATTARHSEPARIWDANTGRLVRALDDVECTGAVQFSPDGRVLACTSRERVTFINVTDWSVLSTVPVRAESIVFSPDSELLAVFNNLGDFGVSLWSVRESRRVATLRGSFSHGAFTPDGRNLVSVDFAPRQAGPNLRIWDIERLSQPLDVLARDACSTMLGATLRRFTQAEINNDQLLIGTWPSRHRDICEGVPGVQALRAVQ